MPNLTNGRSFSSSVILNEAKDLTLALASHKMHLGDHRFGYEVPRSARNDKQVCTRPRILTW
jgi:hypothetical protein